MHFSKAPRVQMTKFQCSSERELHADSKSHLTFDFGAIFVGVIAIWNIGAFFLGHPVYFLILYICLSTIMFYSKRFIEHVCWSFLNPLIKYHTVVKLRVNFQLLLTLVKFINRKRGPWDHECVSIPCFELNLESWN